MVKPMKYDSERAASYGAYGAQKYYLWVLGCQMNKSDGERAAAILEELGFAAAESEAEADLILTMACAVRQTAVDRIHGKVEKWRKMKPLKKRLTVLSGCVLPADKEKFAKTFDILLDTKDINQLPLLLRDAAVNIQPSTGDDVVNYLQVKPKYSSGFQAFVPIMSGCDKFCTYCAVPFTRGRERSRPSEEILREVGALVERGYRQITLLGQNVNSYGIDKPGREMSFAQLLRAVAAIDGDFWVHYTSPHPRDMKDDVLEAMASSSKIAKQVHLPLQAGSTAVLRRMNRTYTREEYVRLMERVREVLPGLGLSTDIIVGFPGETEAQFAETREVLRASRFDMAYIAQYSVRPGTPSAKVFVDDVGAAEKKRRHMVLTGDLKVHAQAYNDALVGRTIKVLVEKERDGMYLGRTEGLKNIRFPVVEVGLVGKFAQVRVESAQTWSLEGVLERVVILA